MSGDHYEFYEPSEEDWPRDQKVDVAKVRILEVLFSKSDAVYYQRQAEILMEGEFFHWITAKALNELADEGAIGSELRDLKSIKLKFYWNRSNRYWKRKANAIQGLVLRFSAHRFTNAVGLHGEMMADAALPRAGLMPEAVNVKSWGGAVWDKSNHDLDRVFSRQGVTYGVEIKNTLGYIEKDEFEIKVRMCKHLGLRPLFVMRFAPKSYMNHLIENGGFGLLLKYQLYPFGEAGFAKEVREMLGITVDAPRAYEQGTIERLRKGLDKGPV